MTATWVRQNQAESVKPLVVPVVVSQDPRGWQGPRRNHQTIPILAEVPQLGLHVCDYEPLIIDLARTTDRQLRQSRLEPAGAIALGALRDANQPGLVFHRWNQWADPGALNDIRAVLTYSVETSALTTGEFTRELNSVLPTRSHTITSTADQFREQGRDQGRLAAFC